MEFLARFRGMDYREEGTKILDVLRRPSYLFLAAVISLIAFSFYALLLNYSLLISVASSYDAGILFSLVPTLVTGYVYSTTSLSLLMSTLISLAIGINFALVAFRLVEMSSFGSGGASSLGGMVLAVLAPACPACATTIFAFAGLSSAFALLPFKGTEVKVLALLLLGGSALWISSDIDKDYCEMC